MVTSPPYNVGRTPDEYRAFLKRVMAEVYRMPVPGGRACIHVANLGRRPYLPLHACIIGDMLSLGFLMRGEIIWDKAASASPSTAWGSWCSPANPTLRDTVFCKQTFTRPNPYGRASTIGRDEERLALPGGARRQGGTSCPLSGGAALSPDSTLHLRG
jgi:site-specific DNA-methyltransferase (adenine-specific)